MPGRPRQSATISGSAALPARTLRERRTIDAMIDLYCRAHHRPTATTPCAACEALRDYARRRLERCVFAEAKPTCAKCTVHCYKVSMRAQVRQVMVWAGPRMLWHHPVLAVRHMMDGRRVAPVLAKPESPTHINAK